MLTVAGVPSTGELDRRRARYTELRERLQFSERAARRASDARDAAAAAGRRFDESAQALDLRGESREERIGLGRSLAARARERAGIEASLAMHEMRRRDILGDDDAFALERELEALCARGAGGVTVEDGLSMRAWEDERGQLEQRMRAAEAAVAASAAELRAGEAAIPDVAELDERAAERAAEVVRLEAFERAATLARTLLVERTAETHEKFARRLEDYAARMLGPITGGRYGEVRIEPATFALRVRAPETNAFVGLDALSAGTREQTYLTVRFAIARMLSEGLERPPLLLDDPFAFWDAPRIARCLPILEPERATVKRSSSRAAKSSRTRPPGTARTASTSGRPRCAPSARRLGRGRRRRRRQSLERRQGVRNVLVRVEGGVGVDDLAVARDDVRSSIRIRVQQDGIVPFGDRQLGIGGYGELAAALGDGELLQLLDVVARDADHGRAERFVRIDAVRKIMRLDRAARRERGRVEVQHDRAFLQRRRQIEREDFAAERRLRREQRRAGTGRERGARRLREGQRRRRAGDERSAPHRPIMRAMTSRCTSLVPSPISLIF